MSADADTGAYGQHCLTVPMNACSKSLPLFRCRHGLGSAQPGTRTTCPSGAYQGYGAPQGSFALQMAAAELADAARAWTSSRFLDKNRVREGDVLEILKSLGEGRAGRAAQVRSCGLDKALEHGTAQHRVGRPGRRAGERDPDVKIGKGVAIIQQGSGLPGLDQACADVRLLSDGTFMVLSGGADLGTGLDTVLAKIAAETLCCDMEKVAVITGDTDTTPFDKGAYASSGHLLHGQRGSQGRPRRCGTRCMRRCGRPAQGARGEHHPRIPAAGSPSRATRWTSPLAAPLPGRRRDRRA